MLNEASKHIEAIRDENIEMGLNQNKKLIEECNKLKIENEFLDQDSKKIDRTIKEAKEMNSKFLN